MVKSKSDAINILIGMSDTAGTSVYDTVREVLNNYEKYDHQGSDRLFLAYCEEIFDDFRWLDENGAQ